MLAREPVFRVLILGPCWSWVTPVLSCMPSGRLCRHAGIDQLITVGRKRLQRLRVLAMRHIFLTWSVAR